MLYNIADFNGAAEVFDSSLLKEWQEIDSCISDLIPQFQGSDQAGKTGIPIFDPKATNFHLTAMAKARGWHKVPVPAELRPFGVDWDAGKRSVLAEWQFSNYPFLWNNIIRSEAIFQSGQILPGMEQIEGLIIVTKSGQIPASNSTLYFEQAQAQVRTVTALKVFTIPIRLIGLRLDPTKSIVDCSWNTYSGRYSREAIALSAEIGVAWGRTSKYGYEPAILLPPRL